MSLEIGTRAQLMGTLAGRTAVEALDAWERRWAKLEHFYLSNQVLLGCVCDHCEEIRELLDPMPLQPDTERPGRPL